jgi:hypothetical protein
MTHRRAQHRAPRSHRASARITTLSALALAASFAMPAMATAKQAQQQEPPPPPPTTVATSFAGHAYGLRLGATALGSLVKLGPVTVVDTGELPSAGGESDAQLVDVNVPLGGISARADVVTALTMGSGRTAESYAGTVAATVTVDNLVNLTAGVLQSDAKASCPVSGTTPVFTGTANLANVNLVLAGKPISIPLNPKPNTTLNLLNGTVKLVLNEQTMSGGRLNVNALHLTVAGGLATLATADVVISHAEAGISCAAVQNPPPVECPVHDFMTGGGQIHKADGKSVSFGWVGGEKSSGLMGHFNAVDHGNGAHIQGSTVSSYVATGATSRRITYDGGALVVNATDNGEPGTNDGIDFTGGYAGYPIDRGNIQLHHPEGCPEMQVQNN